MKYFAHPLLSMVFLASWSVSMSRRKNLRFRSRSKRSLRTAPSSAGCPKISRGRPDGQHLSYLDGGRTGRSGSRLRQTACDGEPRQSWPLWRGRQPQSRTGTIAAATEWRRTSGRRIRSTCSSTPMAACGCTTCATGRAWRLACRVRQRATIRSSRPMERIFRSFAIMALR